MRPLTRLAALLIPLSAAASNLDNICGTWALQQVGTVEELRKTPGLAAALSTPHLRGFCIRVPWNAIDGDFTLIDAGLAVAREHRVAFSVRFMAGRHTPGRVFERGSPYYLRAAPAGKKGKNNRDAGGEKVPTPFMPDGSANLVFESEYEKLVARLAEWCRRNDVHLLHLAWYGQDWAELNHGIQVRNAPGYSYDRWLAAHTRLIDIGLKYAGDDLSVEFPFSGHGPTNEAGLAFAGHVVEKTGPDDPRFICQANGWGPNGDWGAPDAATEAAKDRVWQLPICRAKQSIQPQDYDWAGAFRNLRADRAAYCEVYVPSFRLAHRADLLKEIESFARDCGHRVDGGPPARVPRR